MPASPLPPEWISVSIPKRGNKAEENEDAAVVAPDGLRFAIADGASEGWESGPWAAHLSAAYLSSPPTPIDFTSWLAKVRRSWTPASTSGPVPWYAAMKQEQGSFATIAALELRRSQQTAKWAWRAVAVGDSCLLQIRGKQLETAFPLTSPKEFSNHPSLIPSSLSVSCPEPKWLAGRAEPADLLLLATDAAAARLLDSSALPAAMEAILDSLQTRDPSALQGWCRDVQTKANDDVSVVAIRIPPTKT